MAFRDAHINVQLPHYQGPPNPPPKTTYKFDEEGQLQPKSKSTLNSAKQKEKKIEVSCFNYPKFP
jgi:hypothetical protein